MNQFAAPPQNWPKSRPQISDQIAIIKYFEFIKFNILRITLFVKINYFVIKKKWEGTFRSIITTNRNRLEEGGLGVARGEEGIV